MELISINTLNHQYLLYKDTRSVERFLVKAGLQIHRLGKARYVVKEDFDAFIAGKISRSQNLKSELKGKKYIPQGGAEKEFLMELEGLHSKK